MFIKEIKNPSGLKYLQLVESYRKGQKVRHRKLLSLGKVGDGKLENLISTLSRYKDLTTVKEIAKNLSVKKTYILGPLLILEKLFEELGINQILKDIKQKSKISFDLRKAVFTLVASRFVSPCSKLKVFEKIQEQFYPEILAPEIKLHQFYRVLDVLAREKDGIEEGLYHHGKNKSGLNVDVVLYDLTTLRFESDRDDLGNLRKFGYSKERRGDMVQVVLALLVDKDGIPLGFEVYPGNTFEGHTLPDVVKKIKKKFEVGRFILVADRGLFSNSNLKMLKEQEMEFIAGMRLGVFKKKHDEFYDRSRFKKWAEGMEILETEHEGERLIVTWSRKRADRDRKKREELLVKLQEKLCKKGITGAESFISNEAYKKYIRFEKTKEKPVLDEEAIKSAERKDGFFGIVTNVKDQPAEKILSSYKSLWKVEDSFRELKGTLKARPVFHWTDNRITGHLVMCFIAYLCEAWLTRELRKKKVMRKSAAIKNKTIKPRPLTVASAMKDLNQVRAIPVKFKNKIFWLSTDIEDNSVHFFKAIDMKVPKQLLKVREVKT